MTTLELQLPPVPEPETSAPPPSSARFQPVRFRANSAGIPDTSGPGPVMLQQPLRWSHDFDPDTALSRASIKAESPLFEQIPTAPTPAQGDSSTQLATTEFVYSSQAGFVDEAVLKSRIGSTDGFPQAPGRIGEFRSTNIPGPGPELTAGVISVIGQLELEAGDWDVTATVVWNTTGLLPPVPTVYLACAINEAPNFPGFPNFGGAASTNQAPSGADMTLPLYWRVLRAQPTILMLLSYASNFAPGRCFSYGYMQARRAT